jgi:hypothetical protein
LIILVGASVSIIRTESPILGMAMSLMALSVEDSLRALSDVRSASSPLIVALCGGDGRWDGHRTPPTLET